MCCMNTINKVKSGSILLKEIHTLFFYFHVRKFHLLNFTPGVCIALNPDFLGKGDICFKLCKNQAWRL